MYLHNFFFSSRRRHTRLQGDWSSDMCSSDLGEQLFGGVEDALANFDAIGGGSGHRVWIIDQIRFLVNTKQIGRASCRERVEVAVGAVQVQNKKMSEWMRTSKDYKNE